MGSVLLKLEQFGYSDEFGAIFVQVPAIVTKFSFVISNYMLPAAVISLKLIIIHQTELERYWLISNQHSEFL